MPKRLLKLLTTTEINPKLRRERQQAIYRRILEESPYLDDGNFQVIHPDDVERMFDLYDGAFFGGAVRQSVGGGRLTFRLSRRLTRAGATTARRRVRVAGGVRDDYEITISTTLLYQTFEDDPRPITVGGLECRDRLEAMQRLMEHEMVHLIEMLIWSDSSCAASRFQKISGYWFGHTQHTHALITQYERAKTKFDISPGDHVAFEMEGQEYVGFVNRITRRATVLVENASGAPYSDGKRYSKYYVPLELLRRVETARR